MLEQIHKYSRGPESKLTMNAYGDPETSIFNSGKTDKVIGKANFDGNDVTLRVPQEEKLEPRNTIEVKVLNNGMYQYTDYQYLDEKTDHMPANIIVDIHPTAEEGTEGYPFPTSREEMKSGLKAQVRDLINERLARPQQQAKKNTLKELYQGMTKLPSDSNTVRNAVIYDPGDRLTSQELGTMKNSPVMNGYVELMDRVIGDVVNKHEDWSNRLEGVGAVLDPSLHGVHIPNPETGKSTILMNMFEHIDKNENPRIAAFENIVIALHEAGHVGIEVPSFGHSLQLSERDITDPRVGEYLQSYLNQTMTHGGLNPGHGIAFLKRLAQVFSEYGTEKAFNEADKLSAILTDESGGYNPEVKKLLQIYKESRGRKPITEDFLSPTGDKQAASSGGQGGIPPNDKSDGKRAVIDKLYSAIKEARTGVEEQASLYKKERAQRFAEAASIHGGGQTGAARRLGKMAGEYEKVEPGGKLKLNKEDTDTLFDSIDSSHLSTAEKLHGSTALFKILDGRGVPVRSELSVLDDVFGNGFANKIVEMHGGIGGLGVKLSKTSATMKSMQNAVSLAAPLRHGIGLAYRKEFYPAFRDMFKMYGNKEFFDASMQAIQEHPNYQLFKEAGGFISKAASANSAEEEFLDSYIGNVPKFTGIPQIVGASQRGYTGFLNKLRFDTFNAMTEQAKKLGNELSTTVGKGDATQIIPSEATKAISRYINTATGRGDLPFGLNKMTQELNTVLWSPRMMASRLTMFTDPSLYTKLPKGMRAEGLKSLLGIAALGTMVNGLGYAAGANVNANPLSADFGKIRMGTHVIDPWGGFQQYVVAASRILAGKTDSATPTTRMDIGGRFLANKESPAASLAHTILTAKMDKNKKPISALGGSGDITTEYGQKTNLYNEVGKRFVPIFVQDLHDIATSDPKWSDDIGLSSILTGASLAGMSQDYPAKKSGSMAFRKMKLK